MVIETGGLMYFECWEPLSKTNISSSLWTRIKLQIFRNFAKSVRGYNFKVYVPQLHRKTYYSRRQLYCFVSLGISLSILQQNECWSVCVSVSVFVYVRVCEVCVCVCQWMCLLMWECVRFACVYECKHFVYVCVYVCVCQCVCLWNRQRVKRSQSHLMWYENIKIQGWWWINFANVKKKLKQHFRIQVTSG